MAFSPRPVTCDCPDAFLATVLDTLPGNIRMMACMRCGKSELADAIVTEDRPHDVQHHGFEIVELAPDARAWAAAWPRFVEQDNRRIYLAAKDRFECEADLASAIALASERQYGADLRETLLSLGTPPDHPPASFPEDLSGFREMWHGLQLNDDTPIEELLDAATRWNGPHRLAADILARRPDLEVWACAMISNFDEQNRRQGRYLAKEFHLSGAPVLEAIRSRLSDIQDESTGEISEIGRLLQSFGPAAKSLTPDIAAAAERIKNKDYYAHKDLTELLKHWKA